MQFTGIGGYCTYGLIENHVTARADNALPIALSEDCVLLRDIPRDDVIGFDDVRMPPVRLRDRLWAEQQLKWPTNQQGDATLSYNFPDVASAS